MNGKRSSINTIDNNEYKEYNEYYNWSIMTDISPQRDNNTRNNEMSRTDISPQRDNNTRNNEMRISNPIHPLVRKDI